MIYEVIIGCLAVVILILLVRLIVIKKNIREATEELKKTRDEEYNRQVRITLSDRDMERLAEYQAVRCGYSS